MGGRGSGGPRPGSGRKPKEPNLKVLHGAAMRSDRPKAGKVVEFDHFDAPDDLTVDERLVWLRLAPHAFKAGTLSPATEYQFVMLCRNIVIERRLAADVEQLGGSSHRGIIQRIDAELQRFCLSPMGKPLAVETKDEDPFAEFDEKATLQ